MKTQTETIFAEFIRYNNWANRQVLEACQKLSEAELAAPSPGRMAHCARPWNTSSGVRRATWTG